MKQLQPNKTTARSDVPQNQAARWRTASLAVVALLGLCGSALAQTYNVVNLSSSLTLSGNALGGDYSGQGGNPLALVDTWGGTITLTPTTPGNYTFVGSITADLNPLTPFLPAAGGSPPVLGGIDNYGGVTVSPVLGGATLYAAYRDMTISISGGNAVQGGTAPVTGMTLGFTAAHLDFDAPAVANYRGTVPLGSWNSPSGLNTSGGSVSLSADGSTLTIPVTFSTISFYAGAFPLDVTETWSGQLVALIPEPSSVALVGLGLAAFAVRKIRRGRRLA